MSETIQWLAITAAVAGPAAVGLAAATSRGRFRLPIIGMLVISVGLSAATLLSLRDPDRERNALSQRLASYGSATASIKVVAAGQPLRLEASLSDAACAMQAINAGRSLSLFDGRSQRTFKASDSSVEGIPEQAMQDLSSSLNCSRINPASIRIRDGQLVLVETMERLEAEKASAAKQAEAAAPGEQGGTIRAVQVEPKAATTADHRMAISYGKESWELQVDRGTAACSKAQVASSTSLEHQYLKVQVAGSQEVQNIDLSGVKINYTPEPGNQLPEACKLPQVSAEQMSSMSKALAEDRRPWPATSEITSRRKEDVLGSTEVSTPVTYGQARCFLLSMSRRGEAELSNRRDTILTIRKSDQIELGVRTPSGKIDRKVVPICSSDPLPASQEFLEATVKRS